MRKIISFFIRICISVGVLLFLFKRVELNKIVYVISNANKSILFIILLLFILNYIIGFFRWNMLLKGAGLNIPLFLVFKSYCLGFFSNLFFPSTIGGDLMRSVDLSLRTQNPRSVIASIILDRLSGYSALIAVAIAALLIGHKIIVDEAVFFALGAILIFLVVMLVILFNNFLFSRVANLLRLFGRAGESLSGLHYQIYSFRNKKILIVKNLFYSFIIQMIMPLSAYLTSLALGVRMNPLYFFILVPIITSISAIPVSIAGIGLREVSSMFFFTRVGMPAEVAVSIALIGFSMVFFLALCGGVIYVLTFSHRRL